MKIVREGTPVSKEDLAITVGSHGKGTIRLAFAAFGRQTLFWTFSIEEWQTLEELVKRYLPQDGL